VEADHRRHAEVEPAICNLKAGAGLQYLPSGRFAANAAWLALCGMAYNLARWTTRLGVGEVRMTAKTLRVRYLALPGRLTRPARRPTLHLPADPPCTCPPVGHGIGGGSSPWPGCAASPTRPDRAACGCPEVAPAAVRPGGRPPRYRPNRHGDAKPGPRTPHRLSDASHSPFPARRGVQQARDRHSQSARRWNQG
jgi:hypothetical protein